MKNLENSAVKTTTKASYRDFRDFLNHYDRDKNDSSSSSSTSSEPPDSKLNGHSEQDGAKPAYSSYNDFLQKYGSKRFTPVRPQLPAKPDEKKTLRSEIFIQVSDCVDANPAPRKDRVHLQLRENEVEVRPTAVKDSSSYHGRKSLSPKIPENETVPDEFIYAKTAVLRELVNTSPKIESNGIPVAPKLPEFAAQQKPFVPTKRVGAKPVENNRIPSPPKFLSQRSSNGVNLEARTTTIVPVVDNANVDKNDPNVKKLVYNTYRGLLGAYNNKANDMVSTLPRNMVVKDQGVAKQLESMAAQGPTGPGVGRHRSDVSDRRIEPPLCIQNAMLTKDKKPFTYTPGGIDLSEIRSPRMARRIERNANATGVGEIPSTPPIQHEGPLPPAAFAAMQQGLPVQVFPSGAPMPPPPPPPMNIPPPPPMGPLPTKSVATNDGVFERPDMTKIIPENPMALLRKTSPGVNRRSFVDDQDYSSMRPQYADSPQFQVQSKPQVSPPVEPQYAPPKPQLQMVSNPSIEPQYAPTKRQPQMVSNLQPQLVNSQPKMGGAPPVQPEIKTSTVQLGSLYIPPINQDVQRNVASPPTPPQRNAQSPAQSPDYPQSPAVNLNKSPRPWQNQKPQQEVPQWAARQQSPPPAQQQSPTSPAQKQSPVCQTQTRPPNFQPQPQPKSVHQQMQSPQPDAVTQSNKNGDAVYITQPVVLIHPGPATPPTQAVAQPKAPIQPKTPTQPKTPIQPKAPIQTSTQPKVLQTQQSTTMSNQVNQHNKVEAKGIRIIPIQIEGAPNAGVERQDSKFSSPGTTPVTPASARTFVRQPSWTSTPTQSNSFKVIQKITNTDGEDDDEEVTIEHSPRNSQNFQQPTTEPMRKLKTHDGDRELMNKVKQGVDEENSLHKEVDPRYRGPAIPSKAFRLLQSMTDDGSDDRVASPVPRNSDAGNRGPQVRTIPVQIEGENSGKQYIPPSEQTVQEPKKYTGSAIPSRSFKMLQAMTGDTCADENRASDCNENCQFHPIYCYGFNFTYPPPSLPPAYCCNCCHCHHHHHPLPLYDLSKIESDDPDGLKCACRRTKPPENCSHHDFRCKRCDASSDSERESTKTKQSKRCDEDFVHSNPRLTPVIFCCSPQPYYKCTQSDTDSECESIKTQGLRGTPVPFWGYYPPFYLMERRSCEKEQFGGVPPCLPVWDPRVYNPPPNNCRCEAADEKESKNNKLISDSELDTDVDDFSEDRNFGALQAIRSVSNINVYDVDTFDADDESDEYNVSEASTTENDDWSTGSTGEEIVPHQLSVIFEESDRLEKCVVTSDSSETITDFDVARETVKVDENAIKSDDDDDDDWWGAINGDKLESVTVNKFEDKSIENDEEESVELKLQGNKFGNKSIETDEHESVGLKLQRNKFENKSIENDKEESVRLKLQRNKFVNKSIDVEESVGLKSQRNKFENKSIDDDEEELFGVKLQINKFEKKSIANYEQESIGVKLQRNKFETESIETDKIIGETIESIDSTDSIEKLESNVNNESEEIDFWEILRPDTNDCNKSKITTRFDKNEANEDVVAVEIAIDSAADDLVRNEGSGDNENLSEDNKTFETSGVNIQEIDDDSSTSSTSSDESEDEVIEVPQLTNGEVKPPSIRERIEALQKASQVNNRTCNEGIKTNQKTSALEDDPISAGGKEDDVDSGVTSDMSRHISDNETDFPELRKMTRYQRAATHSRLYQLLQDEYDRDEDEQNETELMRKMNEEMLMRRDSLSLPLKMNYGDSQSFSSSGINSPGSPVLNDRLVNELVQSLLTRKHGKVFRDLPIEKLKSAAIKILQEEFDSNQSSEFSSFLSPVMCESQESTPAQTPQEFYGYSEYNQYYESWGDDKAFKLIDAARPRCPRIARTVQSSVLDSRSGPNPGPETCATSAS